MTSRWSPGDRVPSLRARTDLDTGLTSWWSGWLWLVLEGAAEPWPGWYEKNFLGIEGWVVDGEMGADVHCWTQILPYPVPWPQEEES